MKMSNIDNLIKQYCPNGVEYKRIEGVCDSIIAPKKLNKKNYLKEGAYPIIDQGQQFIVAYTNDISAIVPQDNYVIFGDHTRSVKFANFPFAQGADGLKILKSYEQILPKYLYYSMLNLDIPNRGYNRHWTIVKEMTIPIPLLPVQEEIVKVLDAFTALEAELEAELEARKRQYEYYRNKLLTFDENTTEGGKIKFMQLGDVGTFIRGNGLQKKDFTDTGVGCIHYGQIYTYYGTFAERTKSYVSNELAEKLKKARTGDLIIATTSENVEDVGKAVAWLGNEDICIGGHSYAFHHNQNPKYMAYLFQTEAFNQQKKKVVKGVKVIDINDSAMSKFKFGFPPLDEQERIVAILDKFDSLVNDISEGLPAELTARRQQYEYYRNKLLTFDEAA